jgi:hypothetical protein
MNCNISKYLYEVSDPYSLGDAMNFIETARYDFISHRAIHFGVDYNIKPVSENLGFVGILSIRNIDMIKKEQLLHIGLDSNIGEGE